MGLGLPGRQKGSEVSSELFAFTERPLPHTYLQLSVVFLEFAASQKHHKIAHIILHLSPLSNPLRQALPDLMKDFLAEFELEDRVGIGFYCLFDFLHEFF